MGLPGACWSCTSSYMTASGSGQCQALACCSCLSCSSADSRGTSCSSGAGCSVAGMAGSNTIRASVPWSSQHSSALDRPSSVRGPRDAWCRGGDATEKSGQK
ncbi:hypothetical protein EYF80_050893 [Liparis tanakae]|uniref:Uncharacterized protein n=1 Tax=Liparis tanakae TaxID=230148 RepID=A0A4Z2FDS7_9TELE|nr:hypothetical protein EYF80_050893 [Liparis tanakae]